MANCMISYRIWSDDATLSGGSWLAALPLNNLKDRRISKVARSSDALEASTTFDVDLGAARYIGVVALIGHNLSQSATVRIYGDDASDFASPGYDSTAFAAIPDIYPSGYPLWIDAADRDGALSATDYADGYVPDVIHVPATPQNYRYWRVVISDTGNADGYVQIGRLVVANVYQPTVNFDADAQLGWQTSTSRTETDGGAFFFNSKPQRRTVGITFSYVPEDEAMVHLYELNRYLGTDKQVLFIYNPSDTEHMHRRSFLGVLDKLSPLDIPYGSWMGQGFSIIEEL